MPAPIPTGVRLLIDLWSEPLSTWMHIRWLRVALEEARRQGSELEAATHGARLAAMRASWRQLDDFLRENHPLGWARLPTFPLTGPSVEDAQRFASEVRAIAGPLLALGTDEAPGVAAPPVNPRVGSAEATRPVPVVGESAAAHTPADPNEPQPDGPSGDCWVWWSGTRHEVRKGNVHKLITHMWDRDHAAYADLMRGAVFTDSATPANVRTTASLANRALGGIGVPWRLRCNSARSVVTKVPRE